MIRSESRKLEKRIHEMAKEDDDIGTICKVMVQLDNAIKIHVEAIESLRKSVEKIAGTKIKIWPVAE